MRKPTAMRASAAGATTRSISCGVERPKLRPACRNIGGMLRTPFAAAMTIGKSDAMKIRKIGAALPMPNQITASGIHASGEIGRSIWMSGLTARDSGGYQPSRNPSGMPTMIANA